MWRTVFFVAVAALFVLTWIGPVEAESRSAAYYSGEVQINTTNAGEVLVAIDVAQEGVEGDADHLFILQQKKEASHDFISRWFSEATLLYTGSRLAIVSQNERFALVLGVAGKFSYSEYEFSTFDVQVVEGYELSHTFDGIGVPIAEAASEEFVTEPDDDPLKGVQEAPGQKGGFCDSGGPGADSCTVQGCGGAPSGCSVSCSPTLFACCYCESFGNGRARCKCMS